MPTIRDADPLLDLPPALPAAWWRTRTVAISAEAIDTVRDRAVAAYLGLALGDALGATVEFLTPREIAAFHGVHAEIVGGGWLNLRPGRVTDDTEMSLALGRAIFERGGVVSARAAAEAFSAWMSRKPVDIGHTVRRGISAYRRSGVPFVPDNPQNAGNGAAMRCLPVALATFGAPWPQVVRALRLQGHVTHACALADAGMEGVAALLQAALATPCEAAFADARAALVAARPEFSPDGRRETNPTGFVVDTVRAVLQALDAASGFEAALVDVVNRGGDADTTGAILGMIAGARHGTAALPKRWLKRLDPAVRAACAEQGAALIALSPALSGTLRPITAE
ncbi:ADP-ribosyl-(dinitrogen reductase) glycohydrolase [uncultured Alphaproteobacteria bacterium]|uniref:ADP-ribosyl-(Dinitrogen reductase) glycohydrolase n=1 Tax=uncultured Alphaproteobacteria bacterium TaxID=91750 RepID=A0A212K609_9PROT|nr:ADP-ribosyl-(dinitrogen reductase) glycohydrolase [uncultured Alphaproteobacteria bacterium]